MSPNLWRGGIEPICNLDAGTFTAIGPAAAASLNLNTISQVTVEAAVGPNYTGGRQTNDIGGMMAAATEA